MPARGSSLSLPIRFCGTLFFSYIPLEVLTDFRNFIAACCSAGQNRNMGRWLLMGAIYDGKNWNRKNWL